MNYGDNKVLKRCLVLGGNGFIGGHLVDSLVASGHHVRIFGRPGAMNDCNFSEEIRNSVEFYEGDFSRGAEVKSAIDGVDCIFHLVSTTSPKSSNDDPVFDVETNLIGTIKVLEYIKDLKNIKFIFVSSGGTVYGQPAETPVKETDNTNPICSYGIVKLSIEKYLYLYNRLYGLNYSVLRLANPYGERQNPNSIQGVIPVFMLSILQDKPIKIWGGGGVARDFIYIGDVISALLMAMNANKTVRVLNIGSGVALSINKLVGCLEFVSGKAAIIEYLPERQFDVPVISLDISSAARELDWVPEVSIEEGLRITWAWIKDVYAEDEE
jgi:UDP-glucose 4-epimerase